MAYTGKSVQASILQFEECEHAVFLKGPKSPLNV